jgi:putative ABC transport system permease protein
LVVATAFVDHLIASGYPEVNRDNSLYVWNLKEKDTKNGGSSSGPISFWFINTYIRTLKTPAKVAAVSMFNNINIYILYCSEDIYFYILTHYFVTSK